MCLAVPMQILEVKGKRAIATANNIKKEIDISLVPEAKAGDYVIVHAGSAIQKACPMFVEQTKEAWDLINRVWDKTTGGCCKKNG
ncbi:MAG: HypC/HybG/HupF family hydrogenase formation chaperone [Candidatus Desulfofervidaceae bacterium]|nr:HypC/HybG/HupF family hydrogenase formation chaperone [Candidatus Desulfofervidaceae bacterium]